MVYNLPLSNCMHCCIQKYCNKYRANNTRLPSQPHIQNIYDKTIDICLMNKEDKILSALQYCVVCIRTMKVLVFGFWFFGFFVFLF